MSDKEIFDACLKMNNGDSKEFQLDHDPEHGEMSQLSVDLTAKRQDEKLRYSIRRSGRTIYVRCYKPK